MITWVKKIKLKLFDIVIIFIFVFLAFSLFLFLFRKQSELNVVVKINEENIGYQIGGVPNWFTQLIHMGMKETDTFGRPMAEIKGVKTYFSTDQRSVAHLNVTLKTVYSNSTHRYTYKGKVVSVGSTIELSLDNLLIKGLIIDIDGTQKTKSNKIFAQAQIRYLDTVIPRTDGVPLYIADSVNEGDTMKDSLGNPAVKILKKVVEDAKMTVVTVNGDVIIQRDPLRKDVYLELEIWADKIGGKNYLFGDTDFPILIDSRVGGINNKIDNRSEVGLPFYTDKSLIWLTITKIDDTR